MRAESIPAECVRARESETRCVLLVSAGFVQLEPIKMSAAREKWDSGRPSEFMRETRPLGVLKLPQV